MKAPININSILSAYEFNLYYAKDLVSDIDESMMYKSFGDGLENYPAFVIGHLVVASAMILDDLGKQSELLDGWNDMFARRGPGDPRLPETDSNIKPLKSALLKELVSFHQQVTDCLKNIEPKKLLEPLRWRFDKIFPTVGNYVVFMCITHEAMHLGQLASWRRAAKLESSLGRI